MAGTQFVVDLGYVKLSDEQKRIINAAIQKAVIGELANNTCLTLLIIHKATPSAIRNLGT